MKSLTRLQTAVLAAIAVAALFCTAAFAQAPERKAPAGTIILVHGAWADGSSWAKVIPRLEERKYNVIAVQLPLTSVANDVATVERAIALAPAPVLLVAHSYGGVVITEAGADPKVVGLVYVAAYAPDAGESAFALNALFPPSPVSNQITHDDEGNLKLSPDGILADFAEDLPLQEKTTLIATQGPTAYAALSTAVTSAAWKSKPSWFIIAGRDRIIDPQLEEFMAKRMNAVTTTANSCHVIMLARPDEVTGVIIGAARSLDKDQQ